MINLITWVSPHAGVYGLGNIDNIDLKRIYTPLYQRMYSFSGYFKDPFRYKEYLQMASFLPDLNNEIVNYNSNIITNTNTIIIIIFMKMLKLKPGITDFSSIVFSDEGEILKLLKTLLISIFII